MRGTVVQHDAKAAIELLVGAVANGSDVAQSHVGVVAEFECGSDRQIQRSKVEARVVIQDGSFNLDV